MKYTNICNPSDFDALSRHCNYYEAYYDGSSTSYITYIAAYSKQLLIGFISCITPDFSIRNEQQVCLIEITAMVHPKFRHQKIFSNLLCRLNKAVDAQRTTYNAANSTSVTTQFIVSIDDNSAQKYHLNLYASEYLMTFRATDENSKPILDHFEAFFNSNKSCYLMYSQNERAKPVAACQLEYFKSHTCISNVYVDCDKRGKGIGTLLMKHLIHDYFHLEKNPAPLILHVSSTNPAAFHLYKKCGFSICQEVHFYYINPK